MVGAVLAAGAVVFLVLQGATEEPAAEAVTTATANTAAASRNAVNIPDGSGSMDASPYTMADVATHATAGDCWLVISGEVYDVTRFISSHPGGAAILEGCGTDATVLFETRPSGSQTPHSQNARSMMAAYRIGSLQ